MASLVAHYFTALVTFFANGVITIGNDKDGREMPYDGEFLEHTGFITTLGTGAGGTRLQLRNETESPDRDYFVTAPIFLVASATSLPEQGELVDSPTFRQGDLVKLDGDDIPGNSDSAFAGLTMLCGFYRRF